MRIRMGMLAGAVLALVAQQGSAQAWWLEDDGGSWPVFSFHEYDGSDVNRPGGTPDRPYWHGDDAVPLGLRWQDLEAARAAEAAGAASVSAAVVVADVPPPAVVTRPRRTLRRRRTAVRRAAPICVPATAAPR